MFFDEVKLIVNSSQGSCYKGENKNKNKESFSQFNTNTNCFPERRLIETFGVDRENKLNFTICGIPFLVLRNTGGRPCSCQCSILKKTKNKKTLNPFSQESKDKVAISLRNQLFLVALPLETFRVEETARSAEKRLFSQAKFRSTLRITE